MSNVNVMRLLPLLSLVFSTSLISFAHAESLQTYVIHTYGGKALIPAVSQQLRGTNSTVSSYQDKLVIRTTPTGYAAVQHLLKQIDGIPQSLKISVRVGTQANSRGSINQSRVVLGGRIGKASDIEIQAGGTFGSYNRQSQQNNLYQVQTLSGKPASIGTNTLLSLTQSHIRTRYYTQGNANGRIFIQGQQLVPTVQGIRVTPRILANNQVQIQLNQHNDRLTGRTNVPVSSQFLSNTITAYRGQWVTIGTVNQSRSQQNSRSQGWHGQLSEVVYPIQIKVD